jgi:hypothetical protein
MQGPVAGRSINWKVKSSVDIGFLVGLPQTISMRSNALLRMVSLAIIFGWQ